MAKRKIKTDIAPREIGCTYALTAREIKSFYIRNNLPTMIAWSIALIAGIVATCFHPVGAVLILFSVGYLAIQTGRAIAAYRRSLKSPDVLKESTLTLTEDGFVTAVNGKTGSLVSWLSVGRIVKTGTAYLIRVTAKTVVIVPRVALTESEQAWIDGEVVPVVKNRRKIIQKNQSKTGD